MLQSASSAKERILTLGIYGAGKTNGWATIADWYRRTDTPGTFYVLDTDNTTLRTLDAYADWEKNVQRIDVWDWKQLREETTLWFDSATSDDWLIIDSIDKPWSMVQDYFIEEQFGKEADDFFLAARKSNAQGHPLASDYGSNWTVINKLYSKWMGHVIRWPGHVYAASPAQQLAAASGGKDAKDVTETFGRYGVKPTGQKALGFQFHSVLLLQSPSKDTFTVTSIKDRSRELLVGAPMLDFVASYLIGTAGWTM